MALRLSNLLRLPVSYIKKLIRKGIILPGTPLKREDLGEGQRKRLLFQSWFTL